MGSLIRKCRSFSQSVVARLIAVGIMLVVAGTLARLVFLKDFLQHDIQTLIASHQRALADYVAQDIDSRMHDRQEIIRRLAATLPRPLLSKPDALRDWLTDRARIVPFYRGGLRVLDANGRILAETAPDTPTPWATRAAASDWFRAAMAGQDTAMGAPVPTENDGVVPVASPVRDDHGRAQAVLAGALMIRDPDFLDALQRTAIGHSGGFMLLAPTTGMVIAATDPTLPLTTLPAALGDPDDAHLQSTALVASTGWLVVARMPAGEAFQVLDRLHGFISRNSLGLAAAVILILAIVVPRLLRPLWTAAASMRRMAEGQAPLHPLPVVRRDEIGQMVEGFNYLLAKLQANEARMAHMAHHDTLTGLPNRALFEDRLEQAFLHAERQGRPFALLFIDLDGFKPINDRHGHEVGDGVLRQVAQRLRDAVRRDDTVARYGGDEFVILLCNLDAPATAVARLNAKLHAAITAPMRVDGQDLNIGMSVGVAIYPDDGLDSATLLTRADQAMYRAKRGRSGLSPPHAAD